jgi:hypothetical protein
MDLNEEEFQGKSAEQVQADFFLGTLPSEPRRGRYAFKRAGLKAEEGTVVLFQFDNRIIASATLDWAERLSTPRGEYRGNLYFKPESIRVFDPVGVDRVSEIWPIVKRFNRAKYHLPPSRYPEFQRGLTGMRQPRVAPESAQAQDLDPPPADRVQAVVTRIVRDTLRSNRVKQLHEYKCQICGITITLADGSRYAEGHHLQPLGRDGPDVEENIICVCPNHHAACDFGAIRLKLDELRAAHGHVISKRYIDYHNRVMYRGSAHA